MRTLLSAAHHVARPLAVACLSLLLFSCHSETTAPAVPKSLEFTVQPASTDAVTALAAVRVSALDASGHVLTTYTGPVTVSLATNPGGATLGGTKTQTASNGVAVFTGLTVNRPGPGYSLGAASSGLTVTSAQFTIVPGPPATFAFAVQPSNATAGTAIAPAIQVQAMDLASNVVTTFNGNVTMTIGTNPPGGTLSGTATVAATAGVATFNNLSIDKAGTGYKLTATGGTGSGQSNAFNVTAATATQLVFTTQPSATAAGANISPAIVVTAQDQFNNPATTFANAITIAITGSTGTTGANLSGTKTVTAVNGTATFSSLSIDSAGTGYTLSATATGLVGGFASATFNIVPGAATQLVFTGQPSNATAGASIAPAITVTARDAKGNTATAFTGAVTLGIGTNAGNGTLGGTVAANAVAGVASFSTVNIDKSGIGYTLTAGSGTLTGATSNSFNIIAGAATKLAFTNPPTNSLAGATINSSGGVKVTAQDALGNTDLTYTGNVTVAFGTNAGGGTLSGAAPVAAVAGVATFANLSIDKVGTGYTLASSASGLTAATSGGFNIINSVATHLVFSQQPGNTVAGATIGTFTVTALDASNNVAVDFTASIAVAILNNAGGGTLGGTTSVTAVAGVATFATLNINKTGVGYTLAASAGALTGATSSGFNITPGVATHLAFFTQPTNATAGVAIAPSIVVNALDANNNIATAYTANVVAAIGTNAGGGTLSGPSSVAAVAGVATFANLSIDKSGTGYTLHATSVSLTDATSSGFDITAAALSQLIFSSDPVATQAGSHIAPAVAVSGEDAFGNLVTTFSGNVTVAIGTNGGSPSPGTLAGTKTQAALAGVASFNDLSIDKTGNGYTLSATATGASAGTSIAFDITPGAASKLAFLIGPAASTMAGTVISPPITVVAQDAFGNTVPSFVGSIAVAIGTNPGSGTLGGTSSILASQGVATFSNLDINKAGTGYTLIASTAGLTDATSGTFDIVAGTATKLVFTVDPVATVAGVSISPSVAVSAQDALGNTDPSYVGSVAVAISAGSGKPGAHLTGSVPKTAVAGVATFTDLKIDSAGTNYTLTASATGLTDGVSGTFNINAGTATQLVFGVQPTNAAAGATIAPTVIVIAKDGQGNVDPNFTASVTLTLAVNPPPGATPSGATVSAVAGVATFSSLFLDKVGTGYKLQASGAALTSAQSSAFTITPGAATQLAFIQQPTQVTAGANISPSVRIAAQDALGNTVSSFANNVAIKIGFNPSGGTLTGGQTKAAVAGITTYSGLSIDLAGNGYTLMASAVGLTGATSAAFNVIPSVATQLFFTAQPTVTAAGVTMATVTVVARDASGQTAQSFASNVTLSVTSGTGAPGATVGGTPTEAAITGTATFPDIHIDQAASNYKLTASAGGVTSATSGFFTITAGTATQLAFRVQPSNVTALAVDSPQVEIAAIDALGNVDPTFDGAGHNVAMAISDANGSGGLLSGTTTKAPVKGVATFNNLSIDVAQTGHTLDATASGVTSATSTSFDVTASTANHLEFTTEPSAVTAGQSISPAVVVTAKAGGGSTLGGFNGNVTLTITSGTGTSGASLSGGTSVTVAAVSGVATFSSVSINKKGSGYRLSAVATGLAGATSSSFSVSPAAASQVVFTNDPGGPTQVGVTIPALNPGSIQVTIEDALGNPTASTANVTVAIGVNPGDGTLTGTTTAAAVNGVASFSDLSIDRVGSGYRLSVSSAGLTGDLSQAFSITAGPADHLLFTVAPSDTIAGRSIRPVVEVTVFDALGNPELSLNSGTIAVAITSNTGTGGATLSGTLTQSIVNGKAKFNDLSIDLAGAGYTLSATSASLTGTTSAAFNIRPAPATHIVFTAQPTGTSANTAIAPPVQVSAEDNFGNVDTSYSTNVVMAIGTDGASGGGSTLFGTTTQPSVHGVATFGNLSIDKTGTGFTLKATSGAFALAGSTAFNVN